MIILLSFRDRATDLFRYQAWFKQVAEHQLELDWKYIVETDIGFEMLMLFTSSLGLKFEHFLAICASIGIFLKLRTYWKILGCASVYAIIWYLSRQFYHHEWTAFRFSLAGSMFIFSFVFFNDWRVRSLALVCSCTIHAAASFLAIPWLLSKFDLREHWVKYLIGFVAIFFAVDICISFLNTMNSGRLILFLNDKGPLNYGSFALAILNTVFITLVVITEKNHSRAINFFLVCLYCSAVFRICFFEYTQFASRVGAVFDLAQPFVFGIIMAKINREFAFAAFFLPLLLYTIEFR